MLPSTAVVGDYPDYLSVLIELHELCRPGTFLILVAEHDAGEAMHHIQEFKVQVRIQFQPTLEIAA